MLKGIIGAVFLAVVCTCLYGQQQSITTFIKEEAPVEVIPGMFTTYRSDKHIYWEIPDSLIGREFAVTTTILTAPARPDRDMEKKFGYAGDMIGPVFFRFPNSRLIPLKTLLADRKISSGICSNCLQRSF